MSGCQDISPVAVKRTIWGRYENIAGFKTYVTGPEDAQRAVIFIYDVSGLTPQTLQGADRLKAHLAPLKTMVFVPDFLPGGYVDPEWHPPDSPEEQKASENLRAGSGDIERAVANLLKVRKEIGEKLYPAVDEHVAVGGLGWGGKVSILACGEGNEGRGRKVTVNWTAHPSRLDVADAEALTVPYICLASPGEPEDVVAQIKEIVSKPPRIGHVETYASMFHGWMGARARLDDETNAREYERGYKAIAEFLAKHI